MELLMAGEKRDLDYYMAHPEEMPDDFHTLETSETPEGETSSELQAAIDAKTTGVVEPKQAAKEEVPPKDDTSKEAKEPTDSVIKSKDGKHEIPYGVLQAEREARKAADLAVASLKERLEALEKAAKPDATAKEVEAAQVDEPVLSQEEIDEIAEDFPAIAKLVKGLAAKVTSLSAELGSVKQSESARQSKEQVTASTTVQQAIDANPVLRFFQSKDPDAFAQAVEFDNVLKADKRNAGLSLDERFGKVVKAYEAVHGPVELPAGFERKQTATTPDPKKETKSVEKVIADAESKGTRVASLSDIPGGTPPETDEISQFGLLSPQELGTRFLKMTTEQQNAILNRLI